MAVTIDSTGTPNVAASAVTTVDLTTLTVGAGVQTLLYAMIFFSDKTITSITLNWDQLGTPQAMTDLGLARDSTETVGRLVVFSLLAPTSGNKTLRASWTTASDVYLAAVEFSGVNQTTPRVIADDVGINTAADPVSATVTSDATGATIVAGVTNSIGTIQTQTEIFRQTSLAHAGVASYAIGGASNTHSWGSFSANTALIGIHLQAVPAAAADTAFVGPVFRSRMREW